jgi:hypothetical protein
MKRTQTAYQIYNLANPHFQDVEILTSDNKILKGQFVQFMVVKGIAEYVYPSEKYCFLPEEKRNVFWDNFIINNGEFSEFPSYIRKLGLNDIKKITITPLLVV